MKRLAILLALIASPAFAQQEATPEVQAMSAKIMNEVSAGLQCEVRSIKLAQENEKLKARVKELEGKEKSDAK